MNVLQKRFLTAGATAIVAITGTFLIDPLEGNKNHAYIDMVGVATICRGETKGVKLGDYRTNEECDKSTVEELSRYSAAMHRHVKVDLIPYEEVAYTSFIWNIGETGFKNSTLLKKLNSGDHRGACEEILKWNKATFTAKTANVQIRNGETCTAKGDGMFSCTIKGLTNRRLDEYKTCTGNNPKVNEALHELLISQNAPETSEPVDTSIPPS